MKKKRNRQNLWYGSMPNFLLKMKLLSFLIFVSVATVTANSYSQQTKFNMNFENVTVRQVFQQIEDNSEFIFLYSEKSVDVERKVDVEVTNQTVERILDQVFKGTKNYYEIHDRQIAIMEKGSTEKSLFMLRTAETDQQKSVSGKVTDSTGSTLPGVSVVIKGTSIGVITDMDGKYSLSKVPENANLVFSFVGMKTVEIKIGTQTSINVTLADENIGIEEVVAVGYGTQKKTSLTSAVASVGGDELAKLSSSGNLQKTIQGLIPGLLISDNGGNPGDEKLNMSIRGISSISGSSPLVLVDGFVQSFNGLDPNTVESISVLKDAAATAIYGSRGANGIILVTTKKGAKGKIRVNYEGSNGIQSPTTLPEFVKTEDYMRFRNDLAKNELARNPSSVLPTYTEEDINTYKQNSQTDPIKYPAGIPDLKNIFGDAPISHHSVTMTGGGDIVQSLVNVSYNYQEGLVKERSFERINFRVNNNFDISKTIKAHFNLYYEHSDRKKQASGNPEYWAYQGYFLPLAKDIPTVNLVDANGNYVPRGAKNISPSLDADTEYMGLNQSTPDFGVADAGFVWEPISGLKMNVSYNLQRNWVKESQNIPKWNLGWASSAFNSLSYNNSKTSRNSLNGLLSYEKTFGKHAVNALAGYSTEEFQAESYSMYGQNFYNNELRNISSGTQANSLITNSLAEWGLRSYFGRVGYNYDQKYYAEMSLRSDGSSRFPAQNRYSQFPGVSLGWRISNEKFWASLSKTVSNFKVRYSYGQTGSHDGISNYSYIPQLRIRQAYDFSSGAGVELPVTTVDQTTMASNELTWEKVIQNNFGLDLGFVGNKLMLTLDVYNKATSGILLDLPVPGVVGLNPSKTNAGKVENKGWELEAVWKDQIKDFSYSISAGVARVEDKLVDYGGLGVTSLNSQSMYYRWEGSPLYAIRGYKILGIFQTDAEAAAAAKPAVWANQVRAGDYQYEDVNKDGVITWADDAQLLGSRTPKFTFNLNYSASWKGFEMSMLWYSAQDFQTQIGGALSQVGQWNDAPLITFAKDNYWKEEGDDVTFSKPLFQLSNNTENNSRYVWDSSFIRLKSLEIGYTLPLSITQKLKLNKLKFYVNATNLLTFSKLKNNFGIDPEDVPMSGEWTGLWGGDSNAIRHTYSPQTKTINFGVNIGI